MSLEWPHDFINKIICGDCLEMMKEMPKNSIDMVITSPPYWGLRDYGFEQIFGGDKNCEHEWGSCQIEHDALRYRGHNANVGSNKNPEIHPGKEGSGGNYCQLCKAWKGQLGLEPTPEMYIEHLTEIFNEVKRVLKKGGTLWLNISDTYSGSGGAGGDYNLGGLREGEPKYKQGKIFNNKYKKIDAAWLAAFIDSEGTIQIHKQKRGNNSPSYQPHIAIAMTQREMLDKAYSITGLGAVWKMNYKTSTGKNVYQWSVRGQQGKELIEQIYAYLILKKKQTAILWMLCNNLKDRKDGKRVKPENLKYRENLYQAVKELNQLRIPDLKIIEPIKSRFSAKCLCMIPERLAWSLIQNGWILRNKIVWYKPNAMPSSVTDRFSNRWEYLFMFSKSQRYCFDLDAVRETYTEPMNRWGGDNLVAKGESTWDKGTGQETYRDRNMRPNPDGKNPGDVFEINTQPFPEAHFAVFPEKLCEKPIKAGCPEEVCKKCGKARERIVNIDRSKCRVQKPTNIKRHKEIVDGGKYAKKECNPDGTGGDRRISVGDIYNYSIGAKRKTIGWTSCECNAGFEGGIVLDLFAGAGTALYVAKEMRRRYIGIDIKQEYCDMCEERLAQCVL